MNMAESIMKTMSIFDILILCKFLYYRIEEMSIEWINFKSYLDSDVKLKNINDEKLKVDVKLTKPPRKVRSVRLKNECSNNKHVETEIKCFCLRNVQSKKDTLDVTDFRFVYFKYVLLKAMKSLVTIPECTQYGIIRIFRAY